MRASVALPAAGPIWASAQAAGWLGLVVFFAGHISGDLLWYSVISFGVSRGRRYLQGRLYKGLLIGCAAILLAMVGLFAKLAVENILGGQTQAQQPSGERLANDK